ncbi:hypothetical protein [Noviherbaspirillum denitrificans]|uniref:Excisionase-like domain-containing protein n=1 Tax=Noviherbaspirillum denitrificans TaxID=1968433 RepID=A0A254TAT9_9BURK|nr:hypothetical protein [Noviherbaspirillum denitrificans]OWW19277.1 hypothetical protein AYR66_06955 [Noviherbaspirillum denitrificans]
MATLPTSCMPASDWARITFGDFAPSPYALRCWLEQGHIHPPPEFRDGRWFVHPSAEYRHRHSDQVP